MSLPRVYHNMRIVNPDAMGNLKLRKIIQGGPSNELRMSTNNFKM